MSEMKPMVYSGNGVSELLYSEEVDDGYKLAVYNIRGSHPCAYVQFPGIEELNSYDEVDIMGDKYPHGGFTFLGELPDFTGIWLGWDYAHWNDYTYYAGGLADFGKKWTTEEIVEEAREVLELFRGGYYDVTIREDEEFEEDGLYGD